MASPKATGSTARLFALLLAVVVLSLIGSLVAADRALARAERRAVELDVHGTAVLAERELRLRVNDLSGLFGPLLTPGRDTIELPAGFRGVWIVDLSAGLRATAAGSARLPDAVIRTALDAHDSAFYVRSLVADDTTDGMLLVSVPLSHRSRRLGVAIGAIAGRDFLHTLAAQGDEPRVAAIRSGARTIAVVGNETRSARLEAGSPLHVAGEPLTIVVAHDRVGQAQRYALWAVGVAALLVLVAGLTRERQLALRAAARTEELERLYEEVARSNRMKSEFLANISHELRTPLNAIVGFVEMLREGVYGEMTPRQALPVDRIAASATHLRVLVDRLLDIAKIAAGRVDVHVEPLVLRPFVLNVASEMESLISERGLALTIGVSPALPRIRTDQTHLRQILINLIGNAVKYTSTGGIQIRARLVGEANGSAPEDSSPVLDRAVPDAKRRWVAVHVSDTGIGIPAADQERIFDEFEQVNAGPRTDSVRRGTGLGLAISRRLAHLLGGDISVVSEVGRGSTFTVWLPADAVDAPTETA
jgi:signal transduction histidine kinase